MMLVSCIWQRINRSNKFFQSFQVVMVRHDQKHLKQRLKVRMNLAVKLIRKTYYRNEVDFLHVVRHTQIHQFDLVHLYGCGQAYLGLQKVIIYIKSALY